MYLLRGVQDSGKKINKYLMLFYMKNGIDTSNILLKDQHILSTDDFIVNGKYKFDPRKLVTIS